MTRTRRAQVFWMMACIAAVHCLFGLGLYPRLKSRVPYFLQDRDFYADIAANLAAGRGYSLGPEVGNPDRGPHHPTLRRMPAYPLLLAVLDRLAGPSPAALFLLQLGLVLAACAWIYRIGARLDHLTGLLAMLLLGVYPQVIVYAPRAYSETLLVFFVCGTLYAALRFLEDGRWGSLAAAAALAAGAWLTRSTVGLWLVPMAALLLRADAARGRRLKVALAAAGIFALLLAPWAVRNWRVSGSIVPGTTWNTRSALAGLRVMTQPLGERFSRRLDEVCHDWMNREIERRIGPVDSAAQEVRESGEWSRLYREEVLARPLAAVQAAVRGFFRVFFLTASTPMRVIVGLFNLMLAFLATVGVALAGRESEHRTSNIEHPTSKSDPQTANQQLTTEAQRTQSDTLVSNPQSAIRNPPLPQSAVRNPEMDHEPHEPDDGDSNYNRETHHEIHERIETAILRAPSPEPRAPQSAFLTFTMILWWVVGTTYVFYSVVYPLARYVLAAVPALAVLAAAGGVRLARRRFGDARVDAFTSRL